MSRLFLRPSGTSPSTMRRARPSTMAVLPTPGSPMSTGLFLVRRDSTWMTRRISSSRPMTGSSLPWRAASVRSRPYFSSAWYCSSGFWLVTRWLPRTSLQGGEQLLAADAEPVGQRQEQVLGGEVLVGELGAGRVGGVEDLAEARGRGGPRRRRPWAAWPAPRRPGCAAAAAPCPTFCRIGQDDALVLAEQGGEQVVGGDLGVAGGPGRVDGRVERLLGLRVQRFGSSAMPPGYARIAKLTNEHQLFSRAVRNRSPTPRRPPRSCVLALVL